MFRVNFLLVVVLVSMLHLPIITAGSCEETETAHVKLDLAKQSISNAKLLYPKCHDEKNSSKECSEKDKSLAHLNAAFDLISEAKKMCHSCEILENKVIQPDPTFQPVTTIPPDPLYGPSDCSEIQKTGFKKSGLYQIWPKTSGVQSNNSIYVYCDMETDGGGWIVIQRRGKFPPQKDFYLDWNAFKKGFGDRKREFWLGNENIFTLTNQGNYSVRFDMVGFDGEYRYAVYDTFSIGDENSGYVLNIRNHSGNATNDMEANNGAKFSTKDRHNDGGSSESQCAQVYKSAFWYPSTCGHVSLNGVYQPGVIENKGIWWYHWRNSFRCLASVEIKIRQKKKEQILLKGMF